MAATLVTGKAHCKHQLPEVNLFDIPELMPGARSSATPAQRLEFEQRCIQLYAEDAEEHCPVVAPVSNSDVTVDEMEAMFPKLDPALVRALVADAGTPQQAMETLLVLQAATAEPVRPSSPTKDLGLEDTDAFPCLVDADGWQIASQQLFDRSSEEDLGSAWRDRAKAIASTPAPRPITTSKALSSSAKKQVIKVDEASGLDAAQPETEYELRQRLGQQRIRNRMRFPGARRVPAVATEGRELDVDSRTSEASFEDGHSYHAGNDTADDM